MLPHDNVDMNGTVMESDEGFLKVEAELIDTLERDRSFIGGVRCKESNNVNEKCTCKRVENRTIPFKRVLLNIQSRYEKGRIGNKTGCYSPKRCQLGHHPNSDRIPEAVHPYARDTA